MDIKIYTMYFVPEFGSAPILMNELATYLALKGHNVKVITTFSRQRKESNYKKFSFSKERRGGFSVTKFWTVAWPGPLGRLLAWNTYVLWCILDILSVEKEDILFLRLPPLQLGLFGILARKIRGVKIVLDVQDIHPDLAIESHILNNPLLIKISKALEKWVYKSADLIIVISEGFKKNLLNKGVPQGKIRIVPNWADTDFLKELPRNNRISERFSLGGKFVVMYSGTISLSNFLSLERILEAADLLRDNPDILFVIVGEGLKKQSLLQKADKLNLPNVRFMPFVSYDDLPFLLASSDILLVPLDTDKAEISVPSKLYSFMAAARPILCLAKKGSEAARVINETNCGVCVTPEDAARIKGAIQELKNSGESRNSMAANARDYVIDNFSKEKILKIHEELILSLEGE